MPLKHQLQPQQLISTSIHTYLLPHYSAWVSASAGSGKTKILTDRVLSLLLHGINPDQILCLTFTKAAAAEMRGRVLGQISAWYHMDQSELQHSLTHLLGAEPDEILLGRAATLFPVLIEKLQTLKIQTIHAFSQGLLSQFPLEAGIDPHFSILDPVAADRLFAQCVNKVLIEIKSEHPAWAEEIALYHDVQSFSDKAKAMMKLSLPTKAHLYDLFGLRQGLSWEERTSEFFQSSVFYRDDLISVNVELKPFLTAPTFDADLFRVYQSYFLTAEGEIRKRLLPAAMSKKNPELLQVMQLEAERVQGLNRDLHALAYIRFSDVFFQMVHQIQNEFCNAKKVRRVLDYDDLIQKTRDLLRQPDVAPWILYKLDAAITHILVDEAQDTNKIQWEIVEALYDDFFKGSLDHAKSVFIVGDQKQSIYGFQGAMPAFFMDAGNRLQLATAEGQVGFQHVSLDKSYRSAPAILQAVDAVFNQPGLKASLGLRGDDLAHLIHRSNAPGIVELWPLAVSSTPEKVGGWRLPCAEDQFSIDANHALVEALTLKIQACLATGFLLDPQRGVEPRDILILLRKRGRLMGSIVNRLKMAGIPVAGADRLVLQEEIAVLDLLNLADFVLMPSDDLALANVLKSPFVGWTEDQLFEICHGRSGNLWDKLKEVDFGLSQHLDKLCLFAKTMTPYDFFTTILFKESGLHKLMMRLGPECEDVVDAFLGLIIQFEHIETPTLQGFVAWMRSMTQDFKRDTAEAGRNQVRIMTIHGSKGLQAPLVFMLDSTSDPQPRIPLSVETDLGYSVPTRPSLDHAAMANLKERQHLAERAEYDRLLYVAMTRAQDQLYVMGVKPRRASKSGTWYDSLVQGLSDIAISFDPAVPMMAGVTWEGPALRLADPVLVDIKTETLSTKEAHKIDLPTWITSKNDVLPAIYREVFKAEKNATCDMAAEKGTFLHKLCELLPTVKSEERADVALQLLKNTRLVAESDMAMLIENICEMISSIDLGWVFQHAYAELPLKGEIDGKLYDVRLDRLVDRGSELAIVDFKTHLAADLSEYKTQLGVYQTLVQKMYPEREVKAYVLGIAEKRIILVL